MQRRFVFVLLILVLGVLSTNAFWAQDVPLPVAPEAYVSEDVLVQFKEQGTVDVIVTFNVDNLTGMAMASRSNTIASMRNNILTALPAGSYTLQQTYNLLPSMVMNIDVKALEALKTYPGVTHVNANKLVYPTDAESHALTNADDFWALGLSGYTGAGVRVAVIDTGIDSDHPSTALIENLIDQACFTPSCPGAPDNPGEDEHSHGTHVAGIITGAGGVAPDADFGALKVFNTGSTPDSVILAALDYAIANSGGNGVDYHITNLSLGGGLYADQASCDAANAAYVTAFASLNANGVINFVATGNDYSSTSVSSPGCVTGAVGVGSVNDMNNAWGEGIPTDGVTPFSNTTAVQGEGELTDMLAPGCQILSEVIGGTDIYCGTSMATPTAAGVAALLLGYQPMAPDVLENLLEDTGDPVVDWRNDVTYPRVDVMNAYGALVLDAPENLVVNVVDGDFVLNWDAVADIDSYNVEWSVGGSSFANIGNTTDTTFTTTVLDCQIYTFRVKAVFDGAESLPSNTADAALTGCPVAPSNLFLGGIGEGDIRAVWLDNSDNEEYFSVERAIGDAELAETGTTPADVFIYDDYDVTSCNVVSYQIRAHAGGLFSTPSNLATYGLCLADEPDGAVDVNVDIAIEGTFGLWDGQLPSDLMTENANDPNSSCAFGGPRRGTNTAWLTYTPDYPVNVTIDLSGSSGAASDTLISLYTWENDAWTQVACDDDSGAGLQSLISNAALDAGTTYYLKVARWSSTNSSSQGTYNINWTATGVSTPDAPSDFTAVYEHGVGVHLDWTDNAVDENGYMLMSSTGNGWVEVADMAADTIEYTDASACGSPTYRLAAYYTDYGAYDWVEASVDTAECPYPLLVNGGMEDDVDADKIPDNWSVKGNLPKKFTKMKCNTDTKTFSTEGECAMMLKVPNTGGRIKFKQVLSGDFSSVAAEGDSIVLTFDAWEKGINADRTIAQMKVFYDALDPVTGKPLKQKANVKSLGADKVYTSYMSDALVLDAPQDDPANVTKFVVQFKSRVAGSKIFLDAVDLSVIYPYVVPPLLTEVESAAGTIPLPEAPAGFRK